MGSPSRRNQHVDLCVDPSVDPYVCDSCAYVHVRSGAHEIPHSTLPLYVRALLSLSLSFCVDTYAYLCVCMYVCDIMPTFHGTCLLGGVPPTTLQVVGPMSVAQYMGECLLHPQHGYYMGRDVFGRSGDFITSPEISQVFGECVGVWVASCWQRLGGPQHLDIVEMGPGRGTLAADVLRVRKH